MASADIFESPYSEPPPSAQGILMISSSPELPTLAELAQRHVKRSAPLRSGSNAAPIPVAALTSFTSAKDVLRQAPDDADEDVRSPPPKAKPKTARKRATKAQAKPTPETTAAPDQQEPIIIPSSSPTGKPLKKARSKKAESAQSTISSRVTKSTTTNKSKAKKKTETVSRHFASTKEKEQTAASKESAEPTVPDVQPDLRGTATEVEVSAQPEVAIPRRRDWTPPPEDDFEDSELLSSNSKVPLPKEVFQNMCQDFARPEEKEPIAKPSAEIAEFMKKRKLNDLPANEETPGSAETSLTKAAIPKKKRTVRTITELAMAPYLPEIPDMLLAPGNSETLLKHFDFDGAVKAQVEYQTVVMDKQETKSKGKKKAPAKPRKKKAGTAEAPILLSPSSAMKQASNVDFLFGTSSQLQIDEPPEVLRDLQAAIQASNQAVDENDEDDQSGLWHRGARDVDGSLLAFKIIDTANGTDKGKGPSTPALEAPPKENDFPDINEICALPSQGGSSGLTETQNFESQQAVPILRTTLESDEKPITVPPPPSSRPAAAAAKSKRPVKRPDFTILTDAQLSAKINAYGFKPMKQRSAIIALLEQCWDSSHPETAASTTASVPPGTVKSPAKKPRGRPKKETIATASAPTAPKAATALETPKRVRGRVRKESGSQSPPPSKVKSPVRCAAKPSSSKVTKVEIADSDEDEEVLSVAGRSPSPDPVFSSPPPLDLSISEDAADMSLNLSPTAQESSAFAYITKAVTTTPPAKDPQKPSWHELMLMYTPVVLEDLAAWLNAGELTRVGYDGEVSPALLKQWYFLVADSVTAASSAEMRRRGMTGEPRPAFVDLVINDIHIENGRLECKTLERQEMSQCIYYTVRSSLPKSSGLVRAYLYYTAGLADFTGPRQRPYPARSEQQQLRSRHFVGFSCRRPSLEASSYCRKSGISTFWAMFSTTAKQQRSRAAQKARAKASSSIILLSQTNQVLLLRRGDNSSSFASASVFPGGVLSPFHDGDLPPHYMESYHKDCLAYRLCAIRETFEESGVLLATKAVAAGAEGPYELLVLPAQERDKAREAIYHNKIKFTDWLKSVGGVADQRGLQPFTRWVTPTHARKRFSTQMYIYMLPLENSTTISTVEAELQADSVLPTPDGKEVTASAFEDAATWLSRMESGDITLLPPQAFLLTLISRFCGGPPPDSTKTASSTAEYYGNQRKRLLDFIHRVPTAEKPDYLEHPSSHIPWQDKVISPVKSMVTDDKRVLLTLEHPGVELKNSDRGGDFGRVVLVRGGKRGYELQVMDREEAFKVLRPISDEDEPSQQPSVTMKGAKL